MKYTDQKNGLSEFEVKEYIRLGKHNKTETIYSKTYKKIIYDNLFTLFNFVNIAIACFIALTGSFKNMLFLGVMFWNIVIGIVQEVRAKITLDRISLLVKSNVCVLRDGKEKMIHPDDVVLHDLIKVKSGTQMVADGIVINGHFEVDESLLTGESDPIFKQEGDFLYSGSFVVAGKGMYQVNKVGKENYAYKMVEDAKKMNKHPSQLRDSLNTIIKYVSIMIFPLGFILFLKQILLLQSDWAAAILSTSAALIGMIPEGLVILTSIALAVGIVHLAKHKTLVQELYCLETLARVDVLCLDKTGTLTEGKMEVEYCIGENIKDIMQKLLYHLGKDNATSIALLEHYGKKECDALKVIPFTSSRRYSGVIFEDEAYYLGAYDSFFVNGKEKEKVAVWASEGYRVLTVVKGNLDSSFTLLGFVLLVDKVREKAKETLAYFDSQGVDLRIISGDHPLTVSQIAKRAGLKGYDKYIDATTLKDEKSIEDAMREYKIFGRVTPQQKKMMITALKKQGHCVGMSGDGVNDVLAFKEANVSIAMASGSDVAKNSANLVLLENNFDALPYVLYEGRRVINNIQKVATLFLTKTIISILLTFLTIIVSFPYPFVPIQLTFMSTLCIGIPSFFLALEPNKKRVEDAFLKNVVSISLPGAISVIVCILYIYTCASCFGWSEAFISQLAFIVICLNGYLILLKCSYPYTFLRKALVIIIGICIVLGWTFGATLFSFMPIQFMHVYPHFIVFVLLLIGVSYVGEKCVKLIYK